MSRMAWIAAFPLLLAATAFAQVEPIVRVEVEPAEVVVGESARLRVTVLVPTWFAKPPTYPSFELANAITRLPADSSFPTSERIGGATWSGIVRDYRVYPLLGATYRIGGESIGVAWANPGSAPATANLPVPEIVFRGVVPAGAEGLVPYIAGNSLSLTMTGDGELDDLEPGDAVVLRYRAELEGLPAMFLPPLAPTLDMPGVAVYADEPSVRDGDVASREERLTLVFEAGGEFAIPGVELEYWNLATQSIAKASAPGLAITVTGPPVATPESAAGIGFDGRLAAFLLAAVLAILVVAWRLAPQAARYLRAASERRRLSESYAFREVDRALRSADAPAAYAAMLAWLGRMAPGIDARGFAAAWGDDRLRGGVESLAASNYAEVNARFEPSALRTGLQQARQRYLAEPTGRAPDELPGLNP